MVICTNAAIVARAEYSKDSSRNECDPFSRPVDEMWL